MSKLSKKISLLFSDGVNSDDSLLFNGADGVSSDEIAISDSDGSNDVKSDDSAVSDGGDAISSDCIDGTRDSIFKNISASFYTS